MADQNFDCRAVGGALTVGDTQGDLMFTWLQVVGRQ